MIVRSVAVLGAGTMGAQIAAHFANAGVPSLLLDVTAEAAAQGLARARTLRPDPFFTPDAWRLIATGSFDADLPRIAEADWIVEAVVERLDAKQQLLARVDTHRRQGSVVSSNTSGIPIAALADGRSGDFKAHFLGTHFFNPPRYLRLLEVVPAPDTLPAIVTAVSQFADRRLGKGVVIAKDSPNFIGNHIALYGVMWILRKVASGEYTIDEADAITGPALGRPKSATFRTMDLAGIDVLAHVVRNLHDTLPPGPAREMFVLPAFVQDLLAKGAVGEKAGAGFYRRVQGAGGASEILTLDVATGEYRPKAPARFASIETGRGITDVRERIRMLFGAQDRAGAFLRATLAPALVYTARVTSDIAYSRDDVDRVMRWGFGWDLGPFELAHAIGVDSLVEAARTADARLLDGGVPSLLHGTVAEVPPAASDLQILRSAKDRSGVVRRNAGASLVDLGDGVWCVEFHSKMNAIGGDTVEMLHAGVREAARNAAALVIGNEGQHFSAGANLMLVLLEAQEENWDEVDLMVRAFQQCLMALKYADVPVVAAPAGLAIGGGCEIALHADRVQCATEAYVGLVETGVGLIPAGGGTKEMVLRGIDRLLPGATDYLPAVRPAFETVAFATVSTSGPHAQRLGFLRPTDAFTFNRERLIADAKGRALERVREGYQRPVPQPVRVGGDTVLASLKLGVHLAQRAGRISEHDALIARKLAFVMAGGSLPHASTLTEQQLLDLEREAFLSLLGEPKTRERIQHTLKTGKPLRN